MDWENENASGGGFAVSVGGPASLDASGFLRLLDISQRKIMEGVILPIVRVHPELVAEVNELIGSTIHRSQSSGTLSGGHGGGTEAFTARPTTVPMKAAPVPNPVMPKQVSRPAVAAASGGGAANLPVSRAVVPTSMGTPISFKGKAMRPVGGPPPAGKKDALPGYIFHCSRATFSECIERFLLGAPKDALPYVMRVAAGYTYIFLYDLSEQKLFGLFEAVGEPGTSIEPEAWGGRWPRVEGDPPSKPTPFPAQVRVRVMHYFKVPLNRDQFMPLVSSTGTRFKSNLSEKQTADLLNAFFDAQP